jgi:nitroreductase
MDPQQSCGPLFACSNQADRKESVKKNMTVFDTIKQRRSIGKMTEQSPTREQIELLLTAATHAPNHHRAEPWQFFVLSGNARNELGSIMAETLLSKLEDTTSPKAQAILDKERSKPLRAPVLIVVAAEHVQDPKIVEIENVAAVAAAVQNMLLTAEELGLAAMWRTGDAVYNPRVKQWLGLSIEDHIIAILYLGYPAIPKSERNPQSVESKTTWLT